MMNFKGIIFSPDFRVKTQEQFSRAQKFVDSECLRRADPYVPLRNSILKKSGIAGTVIGSGEIKYTAPYGRKQYYTNTGKGIEGLNASGGTKGLRGKFWFERMKADHKEEILNACKEKFK